MEHYILCVRIFMCIALHYVRQAACPRGSHQFNFQFCLPKVNQGARDILPTVYAYSFSVCRIRLVRYVFLDYVGLGPKLHTCIFIYSLCALHVYECNKLNQYLSILSIN